jgi:HD-GYP domain-containing protein (c-di-GMP phosphodiesterase class II)
MDGKGYPKGLKREQMSVQARMMGIADIFEALTASDRPYKAPMTLSQALKIMDNFRDNGHIDPDLYALFRSYQVPQRYAQKYLAAAQRDC